MPIEKNIALANNQINYQNQLEDLLLEMNFKYSIIRTKDALVYTIDFKNQENYQEFCRRINIIIPNFM